MAKTKKKIPKGTPKKIISKKPVAKKKKKKNKKQEGLSSEIIFDSQVGDTGALFVSNPEDPVLAEALKEFDDLEKKQPEAKVEAPKENNPPDAVEKSFSIGKIISWLTAKFKKS